MKLSEKLQPALRAIEFIAHHDDAPAEEVESILNSLISAAKVGIAQLSVRRERAAADRERRAAEAARVAAEAAKSQPVVRKS